MSEETTTKVSTAFWVIAGLLAVWNLSGLYMYYQMSITTPEQLQAAGYSVVQIEHILGTPAWAHSAYAIAVNAGVLGVYLAEPANRGVRSSTHTCKLRAWSTIT